MTDREPAVGWEDVDPALTALQGIDRAVRSLYEARPALAHCPDYVADMLGHVAREQASHSLRLADLMERLRALQQRRAAGRAALSGADTGGAAPPSTRDGAEAGEGRDG